MIEPERKRKKVVLPINIKNKKKQTHLWRDPRDNLHLLKLSLVNAWDPSTNRMGPYTQYDTTSFFASLFHRCTPPPRARALLG